jgi:uncharacterized protein (DUF983 family)
MSADNHNSGRPFTLIVIGIIAVFNGIISSINGDGSDWIVFGVWLQAAAQVWMWIDRRLEKADEEKDNP